MGARIVAEAGKAKGPRSLVSRAHSRSVNSHQGAFEPTLVPTSFARRNRSPRVDSDKDASARQSRYPSRSGTTRPAVDICDEASGESGEPQCRSAFCGPQVVAKKKFRTVRTTKKTCAEETKP